MSETTGPLPGDPPGAERELVTIERFATLLEETGTGRHHRPPDHADPVLMRLVGLTQQLASTPATSRPAFRTKLLATLMETYEKQFEPPARQDEQPAALPWPVNTDARGPVAPRPRRGAEDEVPAPVEDRVLANAKTQVVRLVRPRLGRRSRLAALIGVAAALAVSGVSMASGDAVPGDALYGVKSLSEQAQLWFADSDVARGHLHLDFARMRLIEARQVAPTSVGGVLATMDRETTEGARLLFTAGLAGTASAGLAEIDSVADFVQQQRAELFRLRGSVRTPDDPTGRSLDLLTAIEARANELRAAVADGCAVTAVDRFGPDPGTC